MKSWAWCGVALGGVRIRLGRRGRRVKQRPHLEYLEDRLAPALSLGLGALTGTVGTPYSQQVTTTGGGAHDTYSYSLAVAQGDPPNNGLPPGLGLNSTSGLLSGTPTASGAYDIVVAVTDSTSGATGREAFPLSISPLIALSNSIPNVMQSVAVSGETITATGPAGDSFTFLASGNVPPGLSLVKTSATTAQLQGTTTQFGTFSFTVTATDGNGYSATQPYQMSVIPAVTLNPAPVTNVETDGGSSTIDFPNDLPTVAVVGQAYSQTITASSPIGVKSFTFTTSGGALPMGLTIANTSSTVTISGTPSAFTQEASPVHINVTATDTLGHSTSAIYILDVEANNASPYVAIQARQGSTLFDDLPAATLGQAYPSTVFTTPAGSGSYTFSLIAPDFPLTTGGVPPGMTFTGGTTATLTGTPTQLGQFNLIVEATNATLGISDSRVFHIIINPPATGLQLGPATLPLASPGVPYSQQITASGGIGTTTLSFSFANGTLTALTNLGLSITQPQSNTLLISGTPISTTLLASNGNGPLAILVTAKNSSGTDTVLYPINVFYTPQQISQAYELNTITLSGGIVGTGLGQTIAIIGSGDAPNLVSTSDPNFANSDLHQFDVAFGLPDPPSFTKLNEFGGTALPPTASTLNSGSDDDWLHELTQDVESAHALAPQANIVLLESGVNIYNAIQTLRKLPGVSVVSMSFHIFYDLNSENSGTNFIEPDIDPVFTSPSGHPMTFVVGAGDTETSIANGEFLNRYPEISPNVLAAGYTGLTLNAQGGIATQPAVFGAGGGSSVQELQPSYQTGVVSQVSTTMRTSPDVTFNGMNGLSEVAVYDSGFESVGAPWSYGSGTSMTAPSWAALLAIVDQGEALDGNAPLDGPSQTLPDLYALAGTSAFLPVTTVSNGTVISPAFGSYNPYGGLGSPVANILVSDLVHPAPAFSGLSAPTISYGTATTTLSGTIAAGLLTIPSVVTITLNGVTLDPTINTTTGAFSAVFTTSALGVAASPYTIAYSFYSYAGTTFFALSSTITTTLTVVPATPTVTWAQPTDIAYGTLLGSAQLDAMASVTGSFVYTPPSSTILSGGLGQALSATFTPTDTTDYTTAPASTTINVLTAMPTFSMLSAPTITAGTATTTLSGQLAAGTLIPSGSVAITLGSVTMNPTINAATGAFSAVFTTSTLSVASSPYTISYSFAGNVDFAPVSATTTLTVTPSSSATVGTVSVAWGTAGTAALFTASDGLRLLPAGRNTDLPWLGINSISITLSAPATLSPGDVTVTGITVANYRPVTISGSGTNYTITLAQPINAADRVTLTIGNAGIGMYTRRLDMLPGDFTDDGAVTSADYLGVYYAIAGPYTVFADIIGDGSDDMTDVLAVRMRNGTTLPPLA